MLIEDISEGVVRERTEPGGHGVFPHLVVRTAGIGYGALQELAFSETCAVITHYLETEGHNLGERGEVLRLLERVIGSISDVPIRRDLISLRRAVFNDRSPSPQVVSRVRDIIGSLEPLIPAGLILEWVDRRLLRESLATVLETTFLMELRSKRVVLAKIVSDSEFGKALAIASPSLCAEVSAYVSSASDHSARRTTRVERSLVNYLCRSALKLSPFSSLTTSSVARIDARTRSSGLRRRRLHRHVSLNEALLSTIRAHVIEHPVFGERARLHLNRSVLWGEDEIRVLRHQYDHMSPNRSRIPREALLSFPAYATMRRVRSLLEQSSLLASELRDQLAMDGVEGGGADTIRFLRDAGVIIPSLAGAVDLSSCQTLLDFLAQFTVPEAIQIRHLLSCLQDGKERFSTATMQERQRLLVTLEQTVAEIFAALGAPSSKSWQGLLLYEDAVDRTAPDLSEAVSWSEAAADLQAAMADLAQLMDGNVSSREIARQILSAGYKGEAQPLLEFIRAYSRALQTTTPSFAADARDYTPNPLSLPSLAALAKIRREFGEAVSLPSEVEQIDFRAVIRRNCWPERVAALGLVPPLAETTVTTCYCQPISSTGSHQLVLNKFHAGPFRSLLRVCSALPEGPQRDTTLKEVRTSLEELNPSTLPCEVRATFDFNVNCQPCTTDWIINYTGSACPDGKQIDLADLVLATTTEGHLLLRHACSPAQPLLPLNFGLMATVFQPPVLYLLLSLGTRDPFIYRPFDPCSWTTIEVHQDVVLRYPRLVYGDCILRRRGYAIPRAMLPSRHNGESDAACFARIWRWKESLGLPDEVFVRTRTFDECIQAPNEARQRKRTLHKPQYVHFANYFLVDGFVDLCKECKTCMYVEEVLPRQADWDSAKSSRALEFVLDIRSGSSRNQQVC